MSSVFRFGTDTSTVATASRLARKTMEGVLDQATLQRVLKSIEEVSPLVSRE